MFKKGDQQREQDSGNREKNSGADSRADVTKLDLVFPFCQRNRIHAVIQKAGSNLLAVSVYFPAFVIRDGEIKQGVGISSSTGNGNMPVFQLELFHSSA